MDKINRRQIKWVVIFHLTYLIDVLLKIDDFTRKIMRLYIIRVKIEVDLTKPMPELVDTEIFCWNIVELLNFFLCCYQKEYSKFFFKNYYM